MKPELLTLSLVSFYAAIAIFLFTTKNTGKAQNTSAKQNPSYTNSYYTNLQTGNPAPFILQNYVSSN
jgi:hypothetical protein